MEGSLCEQVKQTLAAASGPMPVVFYAADTKKKLLAPRRMWVQPERELVEKLRFLLGEKNVIIK